MRFGQLIDHHKIKILLQKSCRKWDRETSSRPLFVFEKALDNVKASDLLLGSIDLELVYIKKKLHTTLEY